MPGQQEPEIEMEIPYIHYRKFSKEFKKINTDPNISQVAVSSPMISCGTKDPPEHNHSIKQVSKIFSLSVPL